MIKLSKIRKELFTNTEHNLEKDSVAVACYLRDGIPCHAGLIINYGGECCLFHYTSQVVEFVDYSNLEPLFCSVLNIIDSEFSGVFLGHCKKILDNANPKYGFTYSGSYYHDGKYYTENEIPEFMTCVGFCINVIKGFIEGEEYFEFSDWTNEKASIEYVKNFILEVQKINPEINAETVSANIRRISPIDYISSSFVTSIPVRKSEIDEINPFVQQVINEKIS